MNIHTLWWYYQLHSYNVAGVWSSRMSNQRQYQLRDYVEENRQWWWFTKAYFIHIYQLAIYSKGLQDFLAYLSFSHTYPFAQSFAVTHSNLQLYTVIPSHTQSHTVIHSHTQSYPVTRVLSSDSWDKSRVKISNFYQQMSLFVGRWVMHFRKEYHWSTVEMEEAD